MERNGRVNSGDVSIYYRAFGTRGRTPILLMHGANYFDSYDWIGVAEALASEREVASYDKRGFGESGWSSSKDYSVDANIGDILAVMGELKWDRPIVVGHSASGQLSIAFAAAFSRQALPPDRGRQRHGARRRRWRQPPHRRQSAAGVRVGRCRHGAFRQAVEPAAHLARPCARRGRPGQSREGLHAQARSGLPEHQAAGRRRQPAATGPRDVWQDLAAVKCPILVVRGTRSDRYTPEILARMTRDYPHIEWATVNSQHDVADQAPQELVAAVRKFTASA